MPPRLNAAASETSAATSASSRLVSGNRIRDKSRDTHSAETARLPQSFRFSVEAVGIEPSSVDPVSHDSVAITRNDLDADTPLKPSESELVDQLGTRVLKLWGVLRVV